MGRKMIKGIIAYSPPYLTIWKGSDELSQPISKAKIRVLSVLLELFTFFVLSALASSKYRGQKPSTMPSSIPCSGFVHRGIRSPPSSGHRNFLAPLVQRKEEISDRVTEKSWSNLYKRNTGC
jgi:hypothetical protein